MNKIGFKTALLFAPLAYAFHHFEEHMIFNFREWRLLYFSDNNPLPTEAVFVILTAITLIYIILHLIFENKATAHSILLFLMATQVANFFFHAGGTLFFQHFSPGLITATLIYIPINIFIIKKALKENWVTKQSILIIFITGSVLFTLFEILGPLPLLTFLIGSYIWIIYTYKKEQANTTRESISSS